jgi:PLP dependent protein
MQLPERVLAFQKQIPVNVTLVAVSKYVSAQVIHEAYQLGLRHFGESRVQEAAHKKQELALPGLDWHLVGHLQTNKVKLAIQTFNWIHSGDRWELLHKMDVVAAELNKKPKVLLQVKLAPDPSKGGFEPAQLLEILPTVNSLNNLEIKGLMTILPKGLSQTESQQLFGKLAELKNTINNFELTNLKLTELSMGMSQDYLSAIEAGTTMLRIGRAIFC